MAEEGGFHPRSLSAAEPNRTTPNGPTPGPLTVPLTVNRERWCHGQRPGPALSVCGTCRRVSSRPRFPDAPIPNPYTLPVSRAQRKA